VLLPILAAQKLRVEGGAPGACHFCLRESSGEESIAGWKAESGKEGLDGAVIPRQRSE
jgi:hypothetical protein